MKILRYLLFFLFPACAFGQGIAYQLSPPAPNAQVRFCPVPDGGYPCPTLTTVYSDSAATQVVTQPITLGSSGNLTIYFAVATTSVTIQLFGPGYGPQNRQIISLGGGGGITSVASLPATCTVGQAFALPDGSIVTCGPAANQFQGAQKPAFVTNGLLADCPLTEGTGTTPGCGVAGASAFGAGTAAPVWANQSGLGTVLAIDNFVNAALTTAGNWISVAGTWTTATGLLKTTVNGGDGFSYAAYTGLPVSQNQWSQITLASAPTSGGIMGPTVRQSVSAETFYACHNSSTTLSIIKLLATAASTLTSQALAGASGEIIYFSAVENPNLASVTLTCKVTIAGVTTTLSIADSTNHIWSGQPGVEGFGVFPTSPSGQNWLTGNLNSSSSTNGLVFGGGQQLTLPASVNPATTIEIYVCYQRSSNTNTINALIEGPTGTAMALSGNATTGNPLVTSIPHILVYGTGSITTAAFSTLNGCGMATETLGTSIPTSLDHIYLNGQEANPYVQTLQGVTAGQQSSGVYNVGGIFGGFFTGTIRRVRAFNRVLSPQEVAQDAAAMNQTMAGYGVTTASFDNSANDSAVVMGDSISSGFNLGTPQGQAWPTVVTLFNPSNSLTYGNSGKPWPQAITASQMCAFSSNSNPDPVADPLYTPAGSRNVLIIYSGTNDDFFNGSAFSSQALGCMSTYAKARKAAGWKVIVVDMISRGASGSCTFDVNKDAFNPLFRAQWTTFADGSVDLGSDPAFADGGCTSATVYQADNIHPAVHGHANLIAPRIQREVNTVFGNHDFSVANTYTVISTAAVATTAGTSSGNTVTITMAATQPWAVGQCVIVTGVTPAGYNSPANQCYNVLTASSTQITYLTSGSALGPITVQGTVQAPQELDQDQYAILGGSAAAPNHILQTCLGRTGHTIYRQITNTNASPWTITSQFGETINGGASFTTPVASATNHPVIALKAILTSNTAGGCTWQASVQ